MNVQPIKTIKVRFSAVAPANTWGIDDGTGDPFINHPYQWNVTLTVTPQPHSSFSTQTPYVYNGLDIGVDDWVSNVSGGFAWKIVDIVSSTTSSVVCIIEDVERYNTFADPSQSGHGDPPALIDGFVFEINDDGLPMLSPVIEFTLSGTWQTDLISRFRARNFKQSHISITQPSHGFSIGNLISLDSNTGDYVKSASGKSVIGQVVDLVPEPDSFTYVPFGRIIYNISPSLPGFSGEIIYTNTSIPGAYTTTSGGTPVFVKIDATTGILISSSSSSGSKTIAFNAIGMPLSSATYFVTLTDDGNIPANLAGTKLFAGTAPSAPATINVSKVVFNPNTTGDVTNIGNIVVATDGSITLPTVASMPFSAGDVIKITFGSDRDLSFSDIALSIRFITTG